MIQSTWRERLHEYLGGTVKGLDAFSQGIGGVEDHIHLLVGFKATHRLSDFMQELKKSSSTWVHKEIGLKEFAWQEGYIAFSVSQPLDLQFDDTSKTRKIIIATNHTRKS